jgi:hypothetical protein
MAAAQDPQIQQIIGQNPQMAQSIGAALAAHVAEHLGYEYRRQIEERMGAEIPRYGKEDDDNSVGIPESIEVQVSQMAAQAAQQLLQQHQQEAQQAKAQQQAQDPLIQLQQQELQLKAQELQRKATKDQTDAQLKLQQIQVERERIAAQQENAGAQLAIKASMDNRRMSADQEAQGFRAGMETMKQMQNMKHQAQMADRQQKKGDK